MVKVIHKKRKRYPQCHERICLFLVICHFLVFLYLTWIKWIGGFPSIYLYCGIVFDISFSTICGEENKTNRKTKSEIILRLRYQKGKKQLFFFHKKKISQKWLLWTYIYYIYIKSLTYGGNNFDHIFQFILTFSHKGWLPRSYLIFSLLFYILFFFWFLYPLGYMGKNICNTIKK